VRAITLGEMFGSCEITGVHATGQNIYPREIRYERTRHLLLWNVLTASGAFILINVTICAKELRYLLMVFQHTHNQPTSLCCSAFPSLVAILVKKIATAKAFSESKSNRDKGVNRNLKKDVCANHNYGTEVNLVKAEDTLDV
jgi:hypothetical protein